MKVKLTKRKLINILNKEPLASGDFIMIVDNVAGKVYNLDDAFETSTQSDCIGCAVGQTFRSLVSKETDPRKLNSWCYSETVEPVGSASADGDLEFALSEKLWLTALSIKFESLCAEKNSSKKVIRSPKHPVKKALVSFIKKEFPVSIQVDIDGFKPRKAARKKKAK